MVTFGAYSAREKGEQGKHANLGVQDIRLVA